MKGLKIFDLLTVLLKIRTNVTLEEQGIFNDDRVENRCVDRLL